jgi:hypothetical protein
LNDTIREIGAKIAPIEPSEGDALTERAAAFFNAASVKTFVDRDPRTPKPAKVTK